MCLSTEPLWDDFTHFLYAWDLGSPGESRPIPRHARGDPDGHVPVSVSVNKQRLSQLASFAR